MLQLFPFALCGPSWLSPHCIIFVPFYCSLSPLLSAAPCLSPPPPSNLAFLGLSFELSLLSLSFHISLHLIPLCLPLIFLFRPHSLSVSLLSPCVYVSKREEVVKHFSSLLIVLTGPIGIPIRPIDFLALSALIFKFLIDPCSKSPAHSLTQSHHLQGQRWRKGLRRDEQGKEKRLVLGKYTDLSQCSELTE